jgi:uncharacterized protein DUF5994
MGALRVLPGADFSGVVRLLECRQAPVVRHLPFVSTSYDVSDRYLATLDSTISAGADMTRAAASDVAAENVIRADTDTANERLDDDGGPSRPTSPSAEGNARVQWAAAGPGQRTDGTWRRRSRDAAAELRELIPAVSARIGASITRVSLNIDAWDGDHPRHLQLSDGVVRLGWFHLLDPATVTLGTTTGPRIVVRMLDGADPGLPSRLRS